MYHKLRAGEDQAPRTPHGLEKVNAEKRKKEQKKRQIGFARR